MGEKKTKREKTVQKMLTLMNGTGGRAHTARPDALGERRHRRSNVFLFPSFIMSQTK